MNAMKSAAAAVTLGAFLGLAVAAGPAQAQSPFAGLTGSWSGNGKISTTSGSERIRCRGTYRASESGSTLALRLRCAGDSYKFEIASDINYDGGSISGSWSETTRQVHGSISGRATANQITAQTSAVGFNAAVSISTRGNSQNVTIRSPGSEISEVSVTMARAGR
jgi:hypothetical protein